jgi:nucleoside-diphosphate-sugar epimerase
MTCILVTGATGFVGRAVVAMLVGRGDDVHALYRDRPLAGTPEVTWHRVDLLAAGEIERVVAEVCPDRLIHLAWHTEHGRIMQAQENIVWVEGSLRMMRAFARYGGSRVLILGSGAEYDWSNAAGPLSELRSPLTPATLYGAAKDALRRLATAYARQEGIELAWGRPFFLYGPGEDPARLVPSVIRSLLADWPVAISSGAQIRDYMHVEDLASALLALLDSPVVGDVNLASGVGTSLDEIVDEILRSTGRPELVLRGGLPDRPWEPPMLVADVTRLRDEVGFLARRTLAEGLAGTVRWWQEQGSRSGKDASEHRAAQP